MLTQERRKELYIETRKFIDGLIKLPPEVNRKSGFCKPLHAFMTPQEDSHMERPLTRDIKGTVRVHLRRFPELLEHEPEKWYNEYFWFNPEKEGLVKRVEILDEIISKM